MPRRILMDQFLLTIKVPQGLERPVYLKIRRSLRSKRFRSALREAVRNAFGHFTSLRPVRFTID